jgi:hypothetical protein
VGSRRAYDGRRRSRGRPGRGGAARRVSRRSSRTGHPLLAAHAACRRPALRLSDVIERSALARGELYGDLLHGAGTEYEIPIGARVGRVDAVVAADDGTTCRYCLARWVQSGRPAAYTFLYRSSDDLPVGVMRRPSPVRPRFAFTTGLLVNLNHVYAGRTDDSWVGFWLFSASMTIVLVGWVAATPFTIRHPRVVQRAVQAIVGPLQHLFEHVDPKLGQYSEKDISPYFWHNGQYPDSDEYKALFDGDFVDYRLRVSGLVEHPVDLSLEQLKALPHHEQITQHFCIQGWSGVAKRGGVSMQSIVDLVEPRPEARWASSTRSAKKPKRRQPAG